MTEPTCEQLCDYDDGDESFIAKFENVIGMTPEEYEAQRQSWAYGNVAIDNPTVTRADVDDAAENMKKGKL